MDSIRILIADDHQLIRDGIDAILDDVPGIVVIARATSGADAINKCRSSRPDVVLMDIVMPGMNGIESARWIKELDASIRIIIVSMEVSKDYVSAAIKVGVDGFLPKDVSGTVLVEAIRSVHTGEPFFNDAIRKLIFEDFYTGEKSGNSRKQVANGLTRRETEVLAMVASGKSNKLVAEALAISVKTVETHKTHILVKLGLSNNAELIHYAIRNKIISI